VELLPAKSDAGMAVIRMVDRIENHHKCKAVYRIHGDRAQELTGDGARQLLENQGIAVTSTAGYDSNANGRAERAVLYFQEKIELYCRLGYVRKHSRNNCRRYGHLQFDMQEKFIDLKFLESQHVSMNLDKAYYHESRNR